MKNFFLGSLMLSIMFMLSGCGQSGPLYLPAHDHQNTEQHKAS